MIDPRPHTSYWIDALKAKGVNAFRQNEVPGSVGGPTGTPPNLFTIVHIERRFLPYARASGENDITGWRAVLVCVGRTVAEAQFVAMRTYEVFNEATPTIDGEPFGPVQFELEQTPEPDNGRYTGRTQFTY